MLFSELLFYEAKGMHKEVREEEMAVMLDPHVQERT